MSEYYECDCGGCTILRMTYDKDCKEFYLSMFVGDNSKFPLSVKLGQIKHILKYGVPYEDQIILNKKDAKKLADDIYSNITNIKFINNFKY